MNTKDTTEVAENSHHLKIFLPKKLLECLPRCPLLPPERLRWNTNEEIASYLITFEKHDEWLSCAPKTRPQNGSIILYNRKKVKYRKDGYLWKKRKDGKTTREDHMKLKVQGMEPVSWQCLYGCYVHSSIVPTFHRRCYWLLQNPDIVLVHYLNVPALEDCGKGCSPIFCSISSDRREWLKWSREELLGQLKPMFHGIKWSCGNGTEEFSVEQLVQQILDTHPTKPAPRTHACLCSGGLDLMGELISDDAPSIPAPAPQLSPALSTITDFSPEWSYPEGGVKVLITGPWTETTEHYSCVFDHIAVPASLVQPGVLRCYCPAHEVGLVSLQVAGREGPLSASVLFEYRARRFLSLPSTQLDWLSLDDNQFRMSILERLEQMEKRMAEIAAAGQAPCQGPEMHPLQDEGQGPGFEARVVVLVESMIPRSTWRGPERLTHGSPFRGMSLLHLAAAQGYARLIETLSQWRSAEIGSLDLEQEVDPLNVDHFSCTPLMWACALGHLEAAVLLFRWNQQALSIPDSLGRLPLSVAHSRGHVRLARCLEELQRQEASVEPPLVLSPPSSSPDTGLSSVSSPSEMSDATFSVTSAYSSAPDGSPPPGPLPASEITMEEMVPGQLSSGIPEAPLFLMDFEATNPKGSPPSPPALPTAPDDGAAPEDTDTPQSVDVIPVDMISLAKQIIEATPERIKQEDFVGLPEAGASMRERTGAVGLSETMSWLASYLENVDHFPSSAPPSELPFERGHLAVPPTPSWAEFLSASTSGKMESDFALLTLSDHEQRELYEAARVIQTAFRKYKGRRLKEQQEVAAAVIQRCYRKYKQLTWIALKFALYKKMTQAAILIQSKFRSYYEQKRFQQSRRAAVLIQQHYRSYRRRPGPPHRPSGPLPARNKGSFLTKKQDQAARKIMRFLRRCRHRMRELKQNRELEGLPQPGLAT
ncbi:PREDICTED: calmodulin-binding transcription activator 2 isoform X7 [Chinchilla lanigera]|uniref:calmodulin-binding transcription activator 2 isoform X7 n=1 Tax=Chinchilla lanigera TaxID=34839 RepID=UPI0006973B52|nr:PREDICTED: calmodulin-binding transcription activator 2 isoform X7 [Chinchilla lanigera]